MSEVSQLKKELGPTQYDLPIYGTMTTREGLNTDKG
jgi:hypothetical protein